VSMLNPILSMVDSALDRAAGFIGSAFSAVWLLVGARPLVSRRPTARFGAAPWSLDMSDSSEVVKLIKPCIRYVFHLQATSGVHLTK